MPASAHPDRTLQPRRSLIFAPGNKPEMFPKALTTGADILCIDLEDAIAPQHKREAREKTLAWCESPLGLGGAASDGVERVVRINCLRTPEGIADLHALLERKPGPTALMMSKVRTADEVKLLDDLLSARGLDTRLHVIIETNDGLSACYQIAQASPRVDALLFGAVDMAAELRTRVSWETLLYARSRLVHAAAGAGIDLIDVPFLDLNDMAGLQREAEACAALGFTGKGAIHPKQIATINAAFSPGEEAVAKARRIIRAFEQGDSGLVVVDGVLIEKPVLRSMYRILAVAERTARAAPAPAPG
jgi:citrate lyase beta subunit